MIKNVNFQEFKTRSGTSEKGEWTLYILKDESGDEYSTFDEVWSRKLGQNLEIDAEQANWTDKGGRVHEAYKIIANKNPAPKWTPPKTATEVVMESQQNAYIDQILKGLREIYKEVATVKKNQEYIMELLTAESLLPLDPETKHEI
jgi:hypothetical protein